MNQTTLRAWRKAALWILGGALALAAILAGLNMTGTPLGVARSLARAIEEKTGWQVDVRGAQFTGLGELRLTEVVIAGEESGLYGRLPVVDIEFDPWRLIASRGEGQTVERVRLVRPRIAVRSGEDRPAASGAVRKAERADQGTVAPSPALERLRIDIVDGSLEEESPAGETARAWRVDGTVVLSMGEGEALVVQELRMRQVGEKTEFALRQAAGGTATTYHFDAKGPAEFFLSLAGFDRWQVTGALTAQGELEFASGLPLPGSLQKGTIKAQVTQGAWAWGAGNLEKAAFDTLELEAEGDGEHWRVVSLTLQRGAAALRASGSLVPANGDQDGSLELTVAAQGLDLPGDIPVLERYGLSGTGAFEGTVSGSLDHPVLSGRLSLKEGTVWHRPVTQGVGQITLSRDRFQFANATLERESATYRLSGEIRWDRSPHYLAIRLDADRGSVSELLKAFALDVDATGEIDGAIHLEGPVGAIRLYGDALVREPRIAGVRYFDEARGQFAWKDGVFTLTGGKARQGQGNALVDGVYTADQLDFAVALSRWPIQAGSGPFASLDAGVSGWVNYEGRLVGSVQSPALSGRFLGGELQLGKLRLSEPVGEASWTLEELRLSDLTLVSAGQGRYSLSGVVSGWRTATPAVELDVRIEGASLAGLLRESGMSLPALLIDGLVSGSLKVSGEAHRPNATFDLALSDDLGVGEPIRLQFGFEDGRLKLSREALLALMRASWS